MKSLTIIKPDDFHVHLRDGDMLRQVVGFTARQFGRAIIMPNLAPPIITTKRAENYKQKIMQSVGDDFTPLMTAYLTETTNADDLRAGFLDGVLAAVKLYPAGATTNSDAGVRDIGKITAILETMQNIGMPLLLHGEVTDEDIDIFDREAVFIERVLQKIICDFPDLKIVLEHITTKQAVDFVMSAPKTVAATITPHHLHINRNAIFSSGIRPHMYCLPIAKREGHRLALIKAATSGSPKFFLGTDSAPHARGKKESSCGCAGIFCAPFAIESYAQVFDEENALDRLEGFASIFGAKFYGLKPNRQKITLVRKPHKIPEKIGTGKDALIPFHAGEQLDWAMKNPEFA